MKIIPPLFIRKYLLFGLVIFLISIFPLFYFCDQHLQAGIAGNFLLFFVLVFISTLIVFRSIQKNESNLFNAFLISMAAKMTFAVIYFWIIFSMFSSDLLIFTFSFFIYYVLFSIFEVSFLVRYLNKKQENDSKASINNESSIQK